MIESSGKWIKIDYADPISSRSEIAARRCLRTVWRRRSLAGLVLTLSPVPFRVEGRFRAGSVGIITYFHLVYSPEFFAIRSGRNWTRNLFHEVTKLLVTKDHGFIGNCTSPSCAFFSYPFHMGILLPLEKRGRRVF